MKKIKLTQGKFALIDDEDFELVSQYTWAYYKSSRTKNNGYCGTFIKYIKKEKKRIYLRMHNLIIQPPKGKQVDHINHNGIDNRKSNLRICTMRENHYNTPNIKSETGYRGVYKEWNMFSVEARKDKKRYRQYGFKTKKEAAIAYNKLAIKLFGEFAVLNKI